MFRKFFLLVLCVLFAIPQSFAAELLTLVPNDAGIVVRANIKQLVSIPEIKKNIEDVSKQQGKEYFEQVKNMGFDPLNDIYSLVAFMSIDNIQTQDPANTNVAFIANGKFEIDKILEAIKTNKVTSEKVKFGEEDGFKTVTYTDDKQNNSKMLFIDNETVVIGTELGVSNVKAVKLTKKGGILTRKDFSVAVTKLNANATLAATIALPDEARQFLSANEQTKALDTIKFLSLDLTKVTDLDINLTGDFDAATKMDEVEKSLKTFGDMLKANKTPYDALNELAQNIKIAIHGTSAIVSSTVSKAALDKLAETQKPQAK